MFRISVFARWGSVKILFLGFSFLVCAAVSVLGGHGLDRVAWLLRKCGGSRELRF